MASLESDRRAVPQDAQAAWPSIAVSIFLRLLNLAIAAASSSLVVAAAMVYNLMNLVASVTVLAAVKISQRESRHFPYGLCRAEDIVTVGVTILGALAGTSCPVVETMRRANSVSLVTEPTPLGLRDQRLTVQVARDELGLPVGIVVKHDGIGDDGAEDYCAAEGIPS